MYSDVRFRGFFTIEAKGGEKIEVGVGADHR